MKKNRRWLLRWDTKTDLRKTLCVSMGSQRWKIRRGWTEQREARTGGEWADRSVPVVVETHHLFSWDHLCVREPRRGFVCNAFLMMMTEPALIKERTDPNTTKVKTAGLLSPLCGIVYVCKPSTSYKQLLF